MSEQPPETRPAGPVVVGYEGSTSGEDAIRLALWLSRVLGESAVVAVVHPSPSVISMARVDAEWVAAPGGRAGARCRPEGRGRLGRRRRAGLFPGGCLVVRGARAARPGRGPERI